jgi:hypothetical protein
LQSRLIGIASAHPHSLIRLPQVSVLQPLPLLPLLSAYSLSLLLQFVELSLSPLPPLFLRLLRQRLKTHPLSIRLQPLLLLLLLLPLLLLPLLLLLLNPLLMLMLLLLKPLLLPVKLRLLHLQNLFPLDLVVSKQLRHKRVPNTTSSTTSSSGTSSTSANTTSNNTTRRMRTLLRKLFPHEWSHVHINRLSRRCLCQ